jgi:aldehyde dehydrogenase (NAD+)
MLKYDRMFIGGELRKPIGTEVLDVISPSTGEVFGYVPLGAKADAAAAVAAAREAFDHGPWPRMSVGERRDILRRAGKLLEPQTEELNDLVTHENGLLRKYGWGNTRSFFEVMCSLNPDETFEREGFRGATGRIVAEPVGVVAAIVAWNGPLALALLKILPALLAGCTVILKPAPETPIDSYFVGQAFADAGLPPGALNIVIADREVSVELVLSRDVDMVSFTGSTAAGRKIGAICGEQVKRAHLELGGKSAAILLDDVDLGAAIPTVLGGGMLFNSGQACVAFTRLLVPESRQDEIVEAICDHLSTARIGDPFDDDTVVGPVVSERQRERVEGYIAIARDEGAKIAFGGGRPAGLDSGWYVEPTLLLGDNTMRSSREEIFGPVSSVISYRDVDDAVRIANDSSYGLNGAVFSADVARGVEIAARMQTGTVAINSIGLDLAFPAGGFKDSGIGYQGGQEGLREFMRTKTICIPRGGKMGSPIFHP